MAKRRMISENLLYDPSFNLLSIEAQNLFVRMLVKTDDYGVFPADQWSMLNLSKKTEKNLEKLIGEMETVGIVIGILHEEKPFLVFKRDRFDEYQSYLIQKRTKSEYLRLEKEAMEGGVFQEILRNSWKFQRFTPVVNRKYKVERVVRTDSTCTHEVRTDDFEKLWNEYPNRQGRKNALRHYVATVKTNEDLQNIWKALENYLKSGNVENGFIKNGSTWFNEWQDWVKPTEAMMKGNTGGKAKRGYSFDSSKYPTLQTKTPKP